MGSFAFFGLELRDKLMFKSMVERAALRAERSWRLGLVETADCVFCLGDPPPQRAPDSHVIALVTHGTTVPGKTLRLPPRVHDILATLNAVHPVQSDRRRVAEHTWMSLASRVHAWMQAGNGTAVLQHRDGTGWHLDAERRQARGFGEQAPKSLAESNPNEWRFGEGAIDVPGAPRAVEPILWSLGKLTGSEGVLDPAVGQMVRLRMWPYLLADSPRSYTQIAMALKQQPRSNAELIVQTRASREDVAGFINAGLLCGFLVPHRAEQVLPAPAPVAPRPGGLNRFFGAIRQALGMPNRA